jgi:transposase-like protein
MSPDKKQIEKKRWNAATSRELAEQILDGRAEPEEVAKQYKLQSYQLWAWIGKAAYMRSRALRRHELEKQRASAIVANTGGLPSGPSSERSYSLQDALAIAEALASRRAK